MAKPRVAHPACNPVMVNLNDLDLAALDTEVREVRGTEPGINRQEVVRRAIRSMRFMRHPLVQQAIAKAEGEEPMSTLSDPRYQAEQQRRNHESRAVLDALIGTMP